MIKLIETNGFKRMLASVLALAITLPIMAEAARPITVLAQEQQANSQAVTSQAVTAEETPAEVPPETPSETPPEPPAQTPPEPPAEPPVQTPPETPSETPSETPPETPAETPSEVPPAQTEPEVRQPRNVTAEQAQLELSFDKLWYKLINAQITHVANKALSPNVSEFDLSSIKSEELEKLGMSLKLSVLQELAARDMVAGDTVQIALPKEYFQYADTTTPTAVTNGLDGEGELAFPELATYEIKDGTLTVTFGAEIETTAAAVDAYVPLEYTVKPNVLTQNPVTLELPLQGENRLNLLLPVVGSTEQPTASGGTASDVSKPATSTASGTTTSENSSNTASQTTSKDTTSSTVSSETSSKPTAGSSTDNNGEKNSFLDYLRSGLRRVFGVTANSGSANLKGKVSSTEFVAPINGSPAYSNVKITTVCNENGYDNKMSGDDLIVAMKLETVLNDVYLEEQLQAIASADPAGFPVKIRTETDQAFLGRIDTYLRDHAIGTKNENLQIKPLTYEYPIGDLFISCKDPTFDKDGNLVDDAGVVIGTYKIVDDKNGAKKVVITYNNEMYNRYGVSSGFSLELGLDSAKLKGDGKQDVIINEQTKILELTAHVDPAGDGTKVDPAYTATKKGPEKVESPVIPYDIHLEVATAAAGETQKYLDETTLSDNIPEGMVVSEVKLKGKSGEPDVTLILNTDATQEANEYNVVGNKLTYKFPKKADGEAGLMSADFHIVMRLNDANFQNFMSGLKLTPSNTFKNSASLLGADTSKTLANTDEVTTKITTMFIKKEGKQDKVNGERFAWTVDVNTSFGSLENGYLVDTLCWSDHMYDLTEGISVNYGGKTETLTPTKVENDSNALAYDNLSVEQLNALTNNGANSVYYIYNVVDGADTKQQAVLIIPWNKYANQKVQIKYHTTLNLGNGTLEDYMSAVAGGTKNISNKVKMLWKNFTGEGIGTGTIQPDWVNIGKDVATNVEIAEKNAVSYDPKTQVMTWGVKLNYYGIMMDNVSFTDTLSDKDQEFIGISSTDNTGLTYAKRNRNDGSSTIGTVAKDEDTSGIPTYKLDKTTTAGNTILTVNVGNMTADEYYNFTFKTKIKNPRDFVKQTNFNIENKITVTATIGEKQKIQTVGAIRTVDNPILDEVITSAYDYSNHSVGWKVTMNPNVLPITDAVLTETMPDGSTFGELSSVTRADKDGKVETGTIDTNAKTITFGTDVINYVATTDIKDAAGKYLKNTAKFTFPTTALQHSYTFNYSTIMSDEKYRYDMFAGKNAGKDISIIDKTTLGGKIGGVDLNVNAAAEGTAKVKNDNITKIGKYREADGCIGWTVVMNRQMVDMGGITVTEELQNPLAIDPTTYKLMAYDTIDGQGNIPTTGGTNLSDEFKKAATSLTDNKEGFEWTIPSTDSYKNKVMVLTFDTPLQENFTQSISNTLTFSKKGGEVIDKVTGDSDYDKGFDLKKYAKQSKKPLLQIIKISANSKDHGQDAEQSQISLGGAVFELTGFTGGGTTYNTPDGKTKTRTTVDEKGNVAFINLLADVVYQVTETTAPTGYVLPSPNTPSYFMFTEKAEVKAGKTDMTVDKKTVKVEVIKKTGDFYSGNTVVMENTPKDSGKIKFTKVGLKEDFTTGTTPLTNVGFTMTRTDETGRVQTWEAVSDATTGVVEFPAVEAGTYTIKEDTTGDKVAPHPWKSDAVLTAVVTQDGKGDYNYTLTKESGGCSLTGDATNGFVVTDEFVTGSIYLTKYESVKSTDTTPKDIPVKGAEFKIYDQTEYKASPTTAKEKGTAVTNDKGEARFSNLPFGQYTIVETGYPTGYHHNKLEFDVTVLVGDVSDTKTFEVNAGDETHANNQDKIINTRAVGSIKITKKDNRKTPEAMKDREFTIKYDGLNGIKDNYPVSEIKVNGSTTLSGTTDASGVLTFSNVPYGDYIITETIPDGDNYIPLEFKVTAANIASAIKDPNFATFAYETEQTNTLMTGDFSFTKKVGGDKFKDDILSGAEFTLTGKNFYNEDVTKTATSGADGIVRFADVPISDGTGYTLTETHVKGYDVTPKTYNVKVTSVAKTGGGNEIKFDVTENTTNTAVTNGTIINTPVKGSISFTKTTDDNALNGTQNLEGAVFGLFPKHQNGTVDDAPAYTKTSDTDGKVTFTDVEFGAYVLKETTTPTGYKQATDIEITKKMLEDSPTTWTSGDASFTYTHADVINNLNLAKISFEKHNQNGNLIPNVKFNVFRQGNGGKATGGVAKDWGVVIEPTTTSYVKYKPLPEVITGANGKVETAAIFPYGKYKFDEIVFDDPISGTIVPFYVDIDTNGKAKYYSDDKFTKPLTEKNGTTQVLNTLKYGYIQLTKMSNEGDFVAGIEFSVYESDTNGKATGAALFTVKTNKDGHFEIPKGGNYGTPDKPVHLVYGRKYVLKETTATGYALNQTEMQFGFDDTNGGHEGTAYFSMAADVATGTVDYVPKGGAEPTEPTGTFVNTRQRGTAALKKVNDKNEPLSGAQFVVKTTGTNPIEIASLQEDGKTGVYKLSNINNGGGTYDVKNAKDISYIRKDDKGVWQMLPGDYQIVETKAPDGYELLSTNTTNVTIPYAVDGTSEVTMTNSPTQIKLKKSNQFDEDVKAYGTPTAGDCLQLEIRETGATGEPVWKYDSCQSSTNPPDTDGSWTIRELKTQTEYTLTETTKPNGYLKAEDITFTLNDNGTFKTVTGAVNDTDKTHSIYTKADNGEINTITMRDIEVYRPAQITKKETGGGALLKDITFSLYQQLGGTPDLTDGSNGDKLIGENLKTNATGVWNTGMFPAGSKEARGLKVGKYYFLETATDSTHAINTTPTTFEVVEKDFAVTGEMDVKVDMTNDKFVSHVQMTKLDGTTKQPLAGATFKLEKSTDSGKNWVNYKTGVKSDANGLVKFDLDEKAKYRLTETTPAEGYENCGIDKFYATFDAVKLSHNQTLELFNTATTANKNFYNIVILDTNMTDKGLENVRKTGSMEAKKVGIQTDNSAIPLKGVKFGLYKLDGTTRTLIDENLITNEQGIITKNMLDWGDYVLVEIATASGYILDTTEHSFTISATHLKDITYTETAAIKNTQNKFTVTKKDIDGITALNGATFNITDEDNKVVATLDAGGSSWEKVCTLAGGKTYVLTETKAPDGYEIAAPVTFTMGTDGTIKSEEQEFTNNNIIVQDKQIEVVFNKTDLTGNTPLTGAVFTVSGTFAKATTDITVNDTNKTTILKGELIAGNTYTVHEVTAPAGYVLAKDFTFTVKSDGGVEVPKDITFAKANNSKKVSTITVGDAQTKVTIEKIDENGETLAGAEFNLAGTFADGTTPIVWTSEKTGKEIEDKLVLGNTYTLTETKAPDGYEIADPVTFKMGADGKIIVNETIVTGNVIKVKNTAIELSFEKCNEDFSKMLGGAEFKLSGKFADGATEKIVKPSEVSAAKVTGFISGEKYTLTETKAPDGYIKIAKPVEFIVNKDGTIDWVTQRNNAQFKSDVTTVVQAANEQTSITISKLNQFDEDVSSKDNPFVLEIWKDGVTDKAFWTYNSATDDSSKLKVDELVTDTPYTLTETKTPNGYQTAKPIKFTISTNGTLKVTSGAIKDNKLPTDKNSNIYKENAITMRDIEVYRPAQITKTETGGGALKNITFSLYQQAGAKPDQTNDTVLETGFKTNEKGIWSTDMLKAEGNNKTRGLKVGKYYFLETATDSTHAINTKPVEFEVKANEFDVTKPETNLLNKDMTNDKFVSHVKMTKLDGTTKQPLAGATFKLEKSKDGGTSWADYKTGVVSDANGLVQFDLDEKARYRLTETTPAEGYDASSAFSAIFTATESAHKNTLEIAKDVKAKDGFTEIVVTDTTALLSNKGLENVRTLGTMALDKLGVLENGTTQALSGVTFELYNDVDHSKTKTDGDTIVGDPLVTDAQGKISADKLSWGDYVLVETATVTGYVLLDTPYPFTIDANHLVYNALSGAGSVKNVQNKFRVSKTDLGTNNLVGAEFTITEKGSGTKIVTLSGDKSVWDYSGLLAGGKTYVLTETKAPDGYEIADPVTFTMGTDGKIKSEEQEFTDNNIIVRDTPIEVEFAKFNEDYKTQLDGAKFTLSGKFSDTAAPTKEILPTDKKSAMITGLIAGQEYSLHEVTAPAGYRLTGDVKIAVSSNGNVTLVGENKNAQIENDTLVKISDVQTLLRLDKVSEDVENGKFGKLSGATLEVQDLSGKKIVYWQSNGTTTGDVTGLEIGDYQLVETVTPKGYKTADPIKFTLGADNSVTVDGKKLEAVDNVATITMKDTYIRGEIKFNKHISVMEGCTNVEGLSKDTSKEIAGAVFGLYSDKAATTPAMNDLVTPSTEITATSDVNGIVSFPLMPQGEYFIKEITAPAGCIKSDTVYKAMIKANKDVAAITTADGQKISSNTVVNDVPRAEITIKKVAKDDENKPRPDSEYGLFRRTEKMPEVAQIRSMSRAADDPTMAGWTLISIATTDEQGRLTFKNVLRNTEYRIKEISAPDGSQVSEKPIEITFKTDEKGEAVIENANMGDGTAEIIDGEIVWKEPAVKLGITKKDESGAILSGAKFELRDKNNKVVVAWTSTNKEFVIAGDNDETKLVAGDEYTLVETKAPDGYNIATPVKFTVEEKLVGPTEDFIQPIQMIDTTTKVKISKVDEATMRPLSGAGLEVRDAAGKVVESFTSSDKPHEIIGKLITNTEYSLVEVSAPNGYNVAQPQKFTVSGDGKVDEVVMKDVKIPDPEKPVTPPVTPIANPTIPTTADNTPIEAVVVVMLGALALGLFARKKVKNSTK